jgi:hypothetical protein
MPKTVKILCIKPDGTIKSKDVELKKTSCGLDICKGNASQGPEFVRITNDNTFTYVLSYNTSDINNGGTFYLTKHSSKLGEIEKNHNYDFTKEVTYEEFEEFDTTVSCDESDIIFVENEIRKNIEKLKDLEATSLQKSLIYLYITPIAILLIAITVYFIKKD